MHGSPAKKLLHRPVTGKTVGGHGEDYRPDVRREVEMLKQRESKVMTIAWIVCGVLLVAAGGVALAATMKHNREVQAEHDHRAALDAFQKKCETFDLKTEEGCKGLLAYAEEQKGNGWEDDPQAGSVVSTLINKAKSSIESIQEKQQEFTRLATVEATLKDPSSKPMDEILKSRRILDSLGGKVEAYGDEFKARVMAQMKIVDRVVLSRLREEAKTLAGGGPDKARSALTAYSKAEDEATRLLDKAMSLKEEETKTYFTTQFKEIQDESNQFVSGIFTPDYVEKTPWTDLLSAEQKENWQNYGMAGFRLEGGKLEAIGPTAGGSTNGLIDVPKAGGYRDFDLEMEFTLKGQVDLLFRLGKRVDNTVEFYNVNTAGQEPLKAGQTYTLHVTFIGNKLTGTLNPADATLANIESKWTMNRKGAFGVQMHEGSELRMSRLRIRELRTF